MAGIEATRVTDSPLCLGTFKDPRVLPCGHTFCLGCITERGRSNGSDPDCPNCRSKFQIPSNGFESLPQNYSLTSVLYESASIVGASKPKVTKRSCKKHSGEELVLYCVPCNEVICLDCMEDDHKTHDCSKISRFAKEARLQLEGYRKSIEPILSQVTSQKSEVKEETKKFCYLLDKSELAINEECDSIIQLVNNHRRLLLEELSNEKQRVAKDLKMRMDETETERLSLVSFNTRIEELLQGADEATPFDIVCQYKDFKDSFDKLKQTKPQAMGQVSVKGIDFIPGDFKDFISGKGNIIGILHKESDSRPTVERCQVIRKDLGPSSEQVNLSLLQRVPIDQDVWYYLKRKHQDRLFCIAKQYLCISRVVCEISNEGMTHSLEVAPYSQDDSIEARKHVADAVELFGQLYQKVSELRIVKEILKIPVAFSQNMPQRLIAVLEEMGVFFLRGDDPCLIGPRARMEDSRQKVFDFISGHHNSPAQTQLNDNFGLAQASETDHVGSFTFKTGCGLTVQLSKGGLLHQSLDAIVNPTSENLSNRGGVANAVAKAAGCALQRECQEYIRKEGKLGITDVMHTSAGNLRPRIKYVVHTVGHTKSDAKDDEELLKLVTFTVFNCLHYANDKLKVHSIAIPPISLGKFGVPTEILGRASFKALKMFDNYYFASCKEKSLHEIHFLSFDKATSSNMKKIFQSLVTQ